ncbi:thiosulfate sulfurtransferase (rhodanese)-like domain-containing protein 2 [Mortierella sp. GBA30]|nr:thiosulfate sulfurtransferase (rhodanese)-like domain-containing protein 2 [Mortierella sp. GBA30]
MAAETQVRTARNRAQNALLKERISGDNSWTCCDLTCGSAPEMYRHVASKHGDILEVRTGKQLSMMRSRTATRNGDDGDAEFRSRRAEKYGSDPISMSCDCDPSVGTVILFYAYLPISDPLILAKTHKSWSTNLDLCGKVKLSVEGINATLAGPSESITKYIDNLTSLPDFKSLNLSSTAQDQTEADRALLERKRYSFFKPTGGCRHVFGETISIKVVEEICPLGVPELSVYHDPQNKRGKLPPSEFHRKLKELGGKDDVVVLDVRNYYESSIGRFPGAITPPIRKFSSFRDYVDRNKDQFSGKTILSYCTGGIRCLERTVSQLKF